MPELEMINSLLSSGEIKSYERQFKPLILGNWRPLRSEESLQGVLQKMSENSYSTKHPFYLALPNSMIPEYLEQGSQDGIIIGSNSMEAVEEGSFTASIAMKLLSNVGARFVVLDAHADNFTAVDPFSVVNEKLLHLLNSNCHAFVVLGESPAQYMNNQTLDVITSQLQRILEDLPEQHLKNLALIYAPSWVTIQGMTGLEANINKSYHVFRYTLENILGQKNASEVRVLITAPHISGSCFSYLHNSHYDGFYFSNIALQSESLLETWRDFNEKAPEVLETQVIIPESVELPEEVPIETEEPTMEKGKGTIEIEEPPLATAEGTLEREEVPIEPVEALPLDEKTPMVNDVTEPETEDI